MNNEADLRWMLARLRPTPVGHFTGPVRLMNPTAEQLPRTYIANIQLPLRRGLNAALVWLMVSV